MKGFWVILGVLALLAGVLAASVLLARRPPPPDCTAHIVVAKGPDGRPLECVCLEGALATCFTPGP